MRVPREIRDPGDCRVLFVQSRGLRTISRAERAARQRRGDEPRSMVVEEVLGADVIDEETVLSLGGRRGAVYRRVPVWIAMSIETRRRASDYDVVITWSERLSVGVTVAFALTRCPTPHMALMFWLTKATVRAPLRVFRRGIQRIVTWSSVQRRYAIAQLGFAPDEVVLVDHPVDLEFYLPQESERTLVFSAGSTMRDFDTLVAAVRDLDVEVLIGASVVRVMKRLKAAGVDVRDELDRPSHVQVAALEPRELRDAMARAQVIVVPLLDSDIDAGVNVILEGMAMARPVVVSQTRGQVDVVLDGVNGFFVPVGDAQALRERIASLVADPATGDRVGRQARTYVERHHSIDRFAQLIRVAALDLATQGRSSSKAEPSRT